MKNKLPLRASVFRMGAMIQRGPNDEVEGACGPMIQDVIDYVPEFNLTQVWSDDGTLFGIRVNGSYTGVLGQFAANQSDALLLPLPISPEADVADMGPAVTASSSRIMSALIVNSFPDGTLKQLFRYSIEAVILVLLTILIFGLLLKKSEFKVCRKKLSLFRSIWHLICLIMKQPEDAPNSSAAKTLVLVTGIAVFFWHTIWLNQMKTEMVSYDTSATAQTVADVIRMNMTAVMISTDPSERQLEHISRVEPNSEIAVMFKRSQVLQQKDYRRTSFVGKSFVPEAAAKFVGVFNGHVLKIFEEAVCVAGGGANFLINREQIGDALIGPWYSRFLSPLYNRLLSHRYVIMRERGIVDKMWNDIIALVHYMVSQSMPDLKPCVYHSVESFMDLKSEDHVRPVSLFGSSRVFRLFSCGIIFACISMLIEMSLVRGMPRSRKRENVTRADTSC